MKWLDRLRGLDNRGSATGPARPRTATPAISWISNDQPTDVVVLRCPSCGAIGAKMPRLTVAFTPLLRDRQLWRVLACPDCTCLFYEQAPSADYGNDEMLTRGRAALYLQQGAGLSQLMRPLARLPDPSGARFLDIGCGFGFSLDFAVRGKGWDGIGFDPGQIAALGRSRLGLPIEQCRPPDDGSLSGSFEVVLAAETIEHVHDPTQFLLNIRKFLKPHGTLILTTPDAALITPGASPGLLVAMLSPELHAVLYTEASMTALLKRAGFGHVQIESEGSSLTAFASNAAIRLEVDGPATRETIRRHLETRAAECEADRDLGIGFAGRCLLECVNDMDLDRGVRVRRRLRDGIAKRFGLNIDRIDRLPSAIKTCSLEEMANLVPLNLAAILYSVAVLDLHLGVPRSRVATRFRLSAMAAAQLRRAVGELGMEDALSEDLWWSSSAEALLCAADAGDPEVPDQLKDLRSRTPTSLAARERDLSARCFVTLVNSGRHGMARRIAPLRPSLHELGNPVLRDVLFCLGILELRDGGDATTARQIFAAVRGALDAANPDRLYWSALRAEVDALLRLGEPQLAARLCQDVLEKLDGTAHDMPADLISRGNKL